MVGARVISDGVVIFASNTTQEAIQEARAYIAKYHLTVDDVRLIKVDEQVRVVTKRPLTLEESK